MFVITTMGGQAMGTPDVCKVPTPAGPVPTPFPNITQFVMTNPSTAAMDVLVSGMPAVTQNTMTTLSSGDEAGVTGGVVSSMFIGPCTVKMGSTQIKAGGKGAAVMGSMMGHNGSNPNIVGSIIAPSQTMVTGM